MKFQLYSAEPNGASTFACYEKYDIEGTVAKDNFILKFQPISDRETRISKILYFVQNCGYFS